MRIGVFRRNYGRLARSPPLDYGGADGFRTDRPAIWAFYFLLRKGARRGGVNMADKEFAQLAGRFRAMVYLS